MHLSFTAAENREEVGVATHKNAPAPIITVPHQELHNNSGMGGRIDAAVIEVKSTSGEMAGRFWVDVHLNKQGRPVMTISTNVGDSTNTKKLVGSWR